MRILLVLFLISNVTFGQYCGGKVINESDIFKWNSKFKIQYIGTYHFGESENESDFHLFFSGDCIVGQVKFGYWDEITGVRRSTYITLTNIRIDPEGKLTSDQHSGQFIQFKSKKGEWHKGLKIDNPWLSWIKDSTFEIGTKTTLVFAYIYFGKYSIY